MTKLRIGWVAVLLLLYAVFWVWYGGNGDPLTQAEGDALLKRLEATHGEVSAGQDPGGFLFNMTEMIPNDDGKEFYAVNLERLNKTEEGRKADTTYGSIVIPLLIARGSHPVFVSERAGLMLGEQGKQIDRVAVVRYRSLRDLIDMASDPKMAEGNKFKTASLEHTEVFITRPVITFVQMRLLVGLLLFFIGVLGWLLISRLASRQKSEFPHA